jgi:acetolactate synthase-1/2/3 large subunit
VKRYATLGALDCVEQILAEARAEEPGPVHIDLNQLEPTTRIDEVTEKTALPAELQRALERVRSARRPVIIVGSLLTRFRQAERLAALAVPVFTTVAAKGAFDERLPHAAGVFTGSGGPLAPESLVIPEADLVIGLGLRAREVIEAAPFRRPTVLFDTVSSAGVHGFGADVLLVPPAAIDQVLEAASNAAWGEAEIESARERLRGSGLGRSDLAGGYFAALDGDASSYALVADTGLFCIAAEHIWRASPDRRFLGSSCGRYMGVGLPMALGVAFDDPKRPVVCAVGDGGIGTYFGELRLAVERRLPLCVVVFADGRYGSIAAAAPSNAHRAALVPPVAEWWRVAEGLGIAACPVESVDAFTDRVSRWDRAMPLFIEIRLDPDAYIRMAEGVR